jgi:O-antigen/teichoic acid export membrane protein
MGRIRSFLRRFTARREDGSFSRDLSVAFLGHGMRRVLGLLAFVIMTRVLTVEAYALFFLAFTAYEIAMYASDFGLNVGVVRFVSKGIRRGDEAQTAGVLKAVFLFKIGAGLVVLAVGYAVAPWLADLLDTPEVTPYLRIAFVGVLGNHLVRFYEAYFRSRLEFERNALFSMAMPAVIALAVGWLWWRDSLTALQCQGVHAVAPLVASALAALLLPHGFLRSGKGAGQAFGSVWRFGRWVWVTNVLGTVRFRLNAILLVKLATLTEVGLYAYGDKLASVLSLVSTTMTTVYVPRASHLLTRDEFRKLLRRTYRLLAWFIPLAVVLPLAARPLIRLHKPEYLDAAPLFAILFVSILFTIAALPARTVLYSIHRPQVETTVQAIALGVTLIFGILLIRAWGALGAAVAMLIQRSLSATMLMGYVYRVVYRTPPADADGLS